VTAAAELVEERARTDGVVARLEVASRLALRLCGRKGVHGQDAEDFASWVQLRLLENDGAILGKFRGESSERTFLAAVVANLFRDHCNRERGKWRPSAAARRGGAVAVELESLLHRDGLSLAAARAQLRSCGFADLSPPEAGRLAATFPHRVRRRPIDRRPLDDLPASASADDALWNREREHDAHRARALLEGALARLPELDRTIVALRYLEGLTVAEISRALGLEQKPLYRRCEQALARLRADLEDAGLTLEALRESDE
jgi:RNA polymerase sigma factor for flagellar operon FliA